MIVGLTGYARSGKDTIADFLVKEHGFKKIAFADPLREGLLAINPLVGDGVRLVDVINEHGWNGYKKSEYSDEIRGLMQRTGTEFVRDIIGDNTWIDIAVDRARKATKVIITDVRFENEFNSVKRLNGVVFRVNRSVVTAMGHSSETGIDKLPVDGVIHNNGSIQALRTETIKKMRLMV